MVGIGLNSPAGQFCLCAQTVGRGGLAAEIGHGKFLPEGGTAESPLLCQALNQCAAQERHAVVWQDGKQFFHLAGHAVLQQQAHGVLPIIEVGGIEGYGSQCHSQPFLFAGICLISFSTGYQRHGQAGTGVTVHLRAVAHGSQKPFSRGGVALLQGVAYKMVTPYTVLAGDALRSQVGAVHAGIHAPDLQKPHGGYLVRGHVVQLQPAALYICQLFR